MEVFDCSDHVPLEMHRHDVAQSTGQQFVEDGERDKRWQFQRLQSDAHWQSTHDYQRVTLDLELTTRSFDLVLLAAAISARAADNSSSSNDTGESVAPAATSKH